MSWIAPYIAKGVHPLYLWLSGVSSVAKNAWNVSRAYVPSRTTAKAVLNPLQLT